MKQEQEYRAVVKTTIGSVSMQAWPTHHDGVIITRAVSTIGYAITHGPTGMAFVLDVPDIDRARMLAAAIGGVAEWGKATTEEEVKRKYGGLPSEVQAWLRQCQQAYGGVRTLVMCTK